MGKGNYSDPKFYVKKQMSVANNVVATSAGGASSSVIARATVMEAVEVKDFNVRVREGDTGTSGTYTILVSKKLDGTGASEPLGTYALAGTTGVADNSVYDGAITTATAAKLDAGDDLVVEVGAGTVLPAGSLKIDVDISYVEQFQTG